MKRIEFDATDDEHALIGAIAKQRSMSRGNVMRVAIRRYVERVTGKPCDDFAPMFRGRPRKETT